MGQELDVDHYNQALHLVELTLEQSPWLGVYAQAADRLATANGPICDIGCGTGRLARLLWLRGEHDYHGLDFSPARIDEARRYNPEMRFDVADMYDPDVRAQLVNYRRFVALEFLEHVDDDLGVIEAIPSGALVVFSVPTYDSAGHVRWYGTPAQAAKRYAPLLDVDPDHAAILPLAKRPHKKIFVFAGVRR